MPRRAIKSRPAPPPHFADVAAPPKVRRDAKSGPAAVMRADWADPEDIRPTAARSARRVHGFVAFDPIAQMAADPRSGVEAKHLHAANKLRELADAVTYGFSGAWMPVFTAMMATPRSGPMPGESARVRASWRLSRLWRRFTPDQQALMVFVVLQNRRIADWCRVRTEETGRRVDPQGEKRLLIGLLDQVWKYFETEISRDLDTGRRLHI